jgi:branched-chain amino acid aminotransferase
MTKLTCYVNGAYLPLDKAYLPVQDLAILRGYGVFDFLRTYHGRPFKLRQHLDRLANSAWLVGLDLPHSLEEIERIVRDTLARNPLAEANIRIVITGGVSGDAITPAPTPGLLVLVTPVLSYPPECYDQGVKVITVELERYLPGAKTINYIPAMIALKQARLAGALEALYLNRQNHILEGTTTNFFIFRAGQLITPKDDILPGVTRDVVLQLAQDQFEVVERAISLAELDQADEAFITASNKEIMPVHQVNEVWIGLGRPGPQTRWLMERFYKVTRDQSGAI